MKKKRSIAAFTADLRAHVAELRETAERETREFDEDSRRTYGVSDTNKAALKSADADVAEALITEVRALATEYRKVGKRKVRETTSLADDLERQADEMHSTRTRNDDENTLRSTPSAP